MGTGRRAPRPFHFRWLIPYLCKDSAFRWVWCSRTATIATAFGVYALAHQYGADWRPCLAAGLLWAGLPSVRFAFVYPVLVDMPTVAVAVWSAVAFNYNPAVGLVAAILAGCVNERAPVFAALFAWSPLPLIGLAAPALRLLYKPGPDPLPDHKPILEHPFRSSLKYHAGQWRDPLVMVAPWGGALAALGALDVQVSLALAVGYLQLLCATDSVRLYQQVAPIVCVAAALVVPTAWLPVLIVVTWFNPLAGNGV